MKTLHRIAAMLLLPLATAACGQSEEPATEPARFALTLVSPASIKANHAGEVVLSGAGFVEGAEVLVDGQPLAAIPGTSATLVDENTIRVQFTYAGPGAELPAGDYLLAVEQGVDRTDPLPLHVRPILSSFEHVRTFPGLFLRNGGFLDVWVMARDSEDAFIAPGHELAGTAGLDETTFRMENVRITQVIDGATPEIPDTAGVADVSFEPVGNSRPLAVSLTIDQSGSLIGNTSNPIPSDPNDERINQSQAFVDRMSATDRATVIRFNGPAGSVVTVTPFTSDKAVLKAGLDGLRTGEAGGTPLYDAMVKSIADVATVAGEVTRAVIVLTDGKDTNSTETPAGVIAAGRAAGVPVYVVGLGLPGDPTVLDRDALQNIADQTGGRFFFAQDAGALAGVFEALSALLSDSYKLEAAVAFDPPLTGVGTWKVEGDLVCEVDGESQAIPLPAFHVSIVD